MIDKEEYATKIQLESPNINIFYFKNEKNNIIFIEGDDYYGSTFFIYRFISNKLFFIGKFILEFPNVENEKTDKKFKITDNKDNIIIEPIINNQAYKQHVFRNEVDEIKKIVNNTNTTNTLKLKEM